MHPIQKHLFDTNFQDLAGSSIEGTLVLSEELINLGIMDFLKSLQAPKQEISSDIPAIPTKADAPLPDPKELLKLVNIEQLNVRMEKGKLLVDIQANL